MPNQIKPFEKIGLCFSGGGYRATFYALGILSYLEQITYKDQTLLKRVKAISTVSGGTLTGVAYAKAVQAPDYNFDSFFKTFYKTFTPENDQLLENAIAKLEDDTVWKANPYKKRSLINAFALTYSKMPLFEGTFEDFKTDEIKQLEQVCFNATDFSFGLTFRFQNHGYFGNNPLYKHNQKEINALRYQVELGDVIASSSCFPVGFEPLVFPDDYFKNQKSTDYKNLKSLDHFIDGIGIMDGGIADNQGIGSMMLIDDRMKNTLDLIIVNDVGSFKMQPWKPDNTQIEKKSTLKQVVNKMLKHFTLKPLYWIILLLGLTLLVLNNMHAFGVQAYSSLYILGGMILGVGLLLTLFGIVASVVKMSVLSRLKSIFKKQVPEPLLDDILTFQKLDISLIQRMLSERLTSAMSMINDVFLKQMRRLNYDLFYSKDALKNKRITATVYKLNGQKTPYNKGKNYNKAIPAPSKILENVCLTASETPTTLWWDKVDVTKNRMETLIACGQFTICYELMDYILDLKKDYENLFVDFPEIAKMYKSLETDWENFNKNPLWLVNQLKP
ncbi:patatin-like phospholipase family protein [Tamlana sp. 2_MG-2023]|uniref:patatin-like phospholipase family protein n=1 Tax=unclassified Tamlana TaxID=2614803 RepID=UPI0026E27127|nr:MULTISPECIES: patatin-like phospholipase family protein [unclassified Tamlana]MDO6759500.1 patatin-like phospholipase family protein [Tamlana sp. 2_MG-2023]MDO6790361.1 patatin-like phospholipase family protein [Tamlana sp. 1_MG-2023]